MRIPSLSLMFLSLASLANAQEVYWVLAAGGVKKINPGGVVLQTAPPAGSRDVAVAPDGKIWYLSGGVRVLNPDGTLFKIITPSTGIAPFSIAFDKQGHAWVSGGIGVEEFDALGVSLGTIPLGVNAPLGICVDTTGNKWIAHRVGPPGSISRIDAVTRAASNHPMPAGSQILPITPYADSRGITQPSHIWVVGDRGSSGEIAEFDSLGTALNRYVLDPAGNLQWMMGDVDATGNTKFIYVGDWSNGNLHKFDLTTRTITTFGMGVGVRGVTFDGFGNLWTTFLTTRVLRRIDPASMTTEVDSLVSATTQLSTRWQHATVTDQLGDLDGDGVGNLIEVMSGVSPFDACSKPSASLSIEGSTKIGANMGIRVLAGAGAASALAFASGVVPPPGFSLPGVGCSLLLDPASLLPFVLGVTGPTTVPVTIPNNAALIGGTVYVQGLNVTAQSFTNVAALLLF